MNDQLPVAEVEAPSRIRDTAPFLQPQSFGELMQYATLVARSSMVPKDFQGRPENIVLAMQWGREIGMSPIQSLTSIAVINGRPGIFGDAAKALVESNQRCEYIEETFERDASGNIIAAVCKAKRRGRPAPHIVKFSVEDAKKAGLWNKEGPWRNYPPRMLQFRARSWALRDVFPDVLRGMGIVEELRDIIEGEAVPVVPETRTAPAIAMPRPRQVETEAPVDAGAEADQAQADTQTSDADDAPFPLSDQAGADHDHDAEDNPPPPVPGNPLTEGQMKTLDRTLERNQLTRVDVRTKWGNVTSANLNDVLRWIPQRAAELYGNGGDANDA